MKWCVCVCVIADVYKDLIMKRDAFKREDIWNTTAGKKTPEAIKVLDLFLFIYIYI